MIIGMTCGCFDIIHSGHVYFLEQCKNYCDYLIIALNTDESVRRIKGNNRPINDLKSRAALLLGIRYVDSVITFCENNPVRVIKERNPDIFFKDSEYEGKNIPEEEVARKIIYIPRMGGKSTSDIINRINDFTNCDITRRHYVV